MLKPFADLLRLASLAVAMVEFAVLPLIRHRLGRPVQIRPLAVKLRRFLDRGGLVYRKLGQYLAMRTDLLPPEVCEELDLLFESVTPMPADEVVRLIEGELGRPLGQCFVQFDPDPVGSASVAQVHRAVSMDGQRLALKVQRAGIQERFAADVRVFLRVASFLDMFRLMGTLSLRRLFEEFAQFTAHELDFELEGRSADGLRREMSAHGYVPYVRWDLTTPRLLAMEFVEGETFLTICRLNETGQRTQLARILEGLDFHEIVANLAEECFHQLFVTGFFHGDPHPGNVILRRDGSFAFIDCGISGTLTPDHRRALSGFVENLALGRFTESADYYTRLCQVTAETDVDAWTHDVSRALAEWHEGLRNPRAPIEQRHMGRLQGNIAIAMRKHRVLTRPNQLLVWRALVLLDTTTLRLPIRFDLLGAMLRFFRRLRGNLPAILRDLYENWRPEAVGLVHGSLALVRHKRNLALRPTLLTLRRATATGGGALRSLAYALAAVSCATIAAGAAQGPVMPKFGAVMAAALFVLAAMK